jgi:hypothetical protein
MSDLDIAYLDNIAFPHNPNSVEWDYDLNKMSFDTIGGRVTQLLSIKINTMTWEGDAGSRDNLVDLFNAFRQVQDNQIDNEISSNLSIPSRNWNIKVFARSMEVGWDYQTVTYPYRIQFEVDEDFGQITSGIASDVFDRLASGINWSPTYSGITNGTVSVDTNIADALSQVTQVSEQAIQQY